MKFNLARRKVSLTYGKLGIVVATTFLVALLLTSIFVYSNPSSITIEPASFVETASYVIWRDGSTYYAKDGDTGAVTSGTNASQIIQSVFTNPNGKTIFFKKAIYSLDTGLYVDLRNGLGDFHLTAEKGTVFQASTDLVAPVWETMLEFYGGNNITISNIIFDLQNTETDYAIIFGGYQESNNVEIYGCQFINGLETNTFWLSIAIDSVRGSHYKIHHNYFYKVWQGVVFEATSSDQRDLNIHDNTFESVGAAINLENGSGGTYELMDSNIHDNYIFGARPRTNYHMIGINLQLASDDIYHNIHDNKIVFASGENGTGIVITQTQYANVEGNIVVNANATYQADLRGGIIIRGAKYTQVVGNNVYGCYIGIYLKQYGASISDYNTVVSNGAWGATYMGISESESGGTNNQIHLCWNGTTWIP